MPTPLSRTRTTASFPARSADSHTDPPGGVNFVALVSRFARIWFDLVTYSQEINSVPHNSYRITQLVRQHR